MPMSRSTTPCLGICTTTVGDLVCKGCKRFAHEIVDWNKFDSKEKELVNSRLEGFKQLILKDRFIVNDKDLLSSKLKDNGVRFNSSLDPITWIFDLLRASGAQELNLEEFGISALVKEPLSSTRDSINKELLELSEAHHERFFKEIHLEGGHKNS